MFVSYANKKDRLLNHQDIIGITKFKNIIRIFEPAPNFVILIKKKRVSSKSKS